MLDIVFKFFCSLAFLSALIFQILLSSVCLLVCLSVHLSVHLFTCLPDSQLFLCLYYCLLSFLSVCLFACSPSWFDNCFAPKDSLSLLYWRLLSIIIFRAEDNERIRQALENNEDYKTVAKELRRDPRIVFNKILLMKSNPTWEQGQKRGNFPLQRIFSS